jgi:O-antigen/teichoic acid export membrane protein
MKKLVQKNLDNSLKLVVKASFVGIFSIALAKIFAFVYRTLIAKYFGPEIYGLFSLSLIIIAWFVSLSSIGLSEGLLRYIAIFRGKDETNKIKYILRSSLTFLLISGLIAGMLLYFSSEFISLRIFHNSQLIIFLKVFGLAFPVLIFSEMFLSIIRSFEKVIAHSIISDVLSNAVKPLILFALILLGFNSDAVIISYVLGTACLLFIAYIYCRYALPPIGGEVKLNLRNKKRIRAELFSYSWPLMLVGIIGTVLFWADSLLIGYFKGAVEVGIYNAAVPIATLLFVAPALFIKLFFPMITREYSKKNFRLIEEISKQVGKWVFILNLPVLIIVILFPQAVINVLFGSDYLIAANPLRFLALGSMTFAIAMVSNNLVSMTGKSKVILLDLVGINVINIILNVILIPLPRIFWLNNSNGLNGASISTMISLFLYSLILFVQAKKYAKVIALRTKMVNVILAATIPTALLVLIRNFVGRGAWTLILLSLFFFFMYVLMVFLFKGLDKNDFMIIATIKNKLVIGKQKIKFKVTGTKIIPKNVLERHEKLK